MQKTADFLKFMVCPHGQGGKGLASADILRSREKGVIFSRFCAASLNVNVALNPWILIGHSILPCYNSHHLIQQQKIMLNEIQLNVEFLHSGDRRPYSTLINLAVKIFFATLWMSHLYSEAPKHQCCKHQYRQHQCRKHQCCKHQCRKHQCRKYQCRKHQCRIT